MTPDGGQAGDGHKADAGESQAGDGHRADAGENGPGGRRLTERQRQREILRLLASRYQGIGSALEFQSPYQLLVATALAAQTTDAQVNKVTRRLFADYPNAASMAGVTPETLIPYIQSLGLYRNKAKNIAALAELLLFRFDGQVPKTREELTQLPGIGRKTANVVLANAFNIPALAVDTHVFRVANRLRLAAGKTPDEVEAQLCRLIPRRDWSDAHHWLIWHGRRCCKARQPDCPLCPAAALCPHALGESDGALK
ncbi:MAG: endonuclease III [Peptococcaceae bacterium]|nr:endonuclease III [Peptococcaceae bacterium]